MGMVLSCSRRTREGCSSCSTISSRTRSSSRPTAAVSTSMSSRSPTALSSRWRIRGWASGAARRLGGRLGLERRPRARGCTRAPAAPRGPRQRHAGARRPRGARADPRRRRAAGYARPAADGEGAGVGRPPRLRLGCGRLREEAVLARRAVDTRARAARRRLDRGRLVAVAEAADGLDRDVVGVVRVELAPEVADVELYLVAADAVGIAPDELE